MVQIPIARGEGKVGRDFLAAFRCSFAHVRRFRYVLLIVARRLLETQMFGQLLCSTIRRRWHVCVSSACASEDSLRDPC
jgi:hypothetical protein